MLNSFVAVAFLVLLVVPGITASLFVRWASMLGQWTRVVTLKMIC